VTASLPKGRPAPQREVNPSTGRARTETNMNFSCGRG
jgi:hypothetical protein